jgi:uncharacterized protein (TIGR02453 family)
MVVTRYFTPELFRFLKELRHNNDREWFLKNKARYETAVRDPFLRLIADLGPRLKTLSPYFLVDPSPIGGSMMRIYRDLRFSKDKTPYKTFVAAHFEHKDGANGASPALYLRLEPGDSIIGGGVWRPPPPALREIRDAIAAKPDKWQKAVAGRTFRSGCGMVGESLKKAPPGYAPDQPFIEDIKRKDFATSVLLEDREVSGTDFIGTLMERLHPIVPFMRFLTEALGLRY